MRINGKNHDELINVQGGTDGELYHLTADQHATVIAGADLVNSQVLSYTQDEEREFFKDDFTSDTSDNYTGNVLNFTWISGEITKNASSATFLYPPECKADIFKITLKTPSIPTSSSDGIRIYTQTDTTYPYLMLYGGPVAYAKIYYDGGASSTELYSSYSAGVKFDIEFNRINGTVRIGNVTVSDSHLLKNESYTNIKIYGLENSPNFTIYEVSTSPSISDSDDFSVDTTDRWASVAGTTAFDTDHINLTTASATNGKGTYRRRSYLNEAGSQKINVTLPTGVDGDFVNLVTHSSNATMDNGIGVGLQSDGATGWNLTTLDGTTVTEGVASTLVDGDVVTFEVEKDISGAYWYYIYDSTSVKPTTPTGKLFTTLTRGYTGIYCNGAGATTQTFAITDFECRCETVIGDTNAGTKMYRGTQIGEFKDSSDVVNVCSRYVDDFEADSSAEYETYAPVSDVFVFDQTLATVSDKTTVGNVSDQLKVKQRFGSAHYSYDVEFKLLANFNGMATICDQSEESVNVPLDNVTAAPNVESYLFYYTQTDNSFKLVKRGIGTLTFIGIYSFTATVDTMYHLDIVHNALSGRILIYLDGLLIINVVDTTYKSGYFSFAKVYSTDSQTSWSNLQINAISTDSPNGISYCIPSVSHGGRYDVQESITQKVSMQDIVSSRISSNMLTAKTLLDTESTVFKVIIKNDTDDTAINIDPENDITEWIIPLQTEFVEHYTDELLTRFKDKDDDIIVQVTTDKEPDSAIYHAYSCIKPITIITEDDLV